LASSHYSGVNNHATVSPITPANTEDYFLIPTLACDIGGTRIKLGVVFRGELLAEQIIPSQSGKSLSVDLRRIADGLHAVCQEAGIKAASCCGIGMGFPALINNKTSRVIDQFGKYTDAPDIDLNSWAREALGLPLAMDNDARLALIGEWQHGAGRGCDNLAMVTLGTGIGTAIVTEGRVLRGPHFQAGNLGGHISINTGGRRCYCGNIGCIEAEVGSQYLQDAAEHTSGYSQSSLAGVSEIDYRLVFEHAAADAPVALELRDRAITHWSALCVSLAHSFDVERIILGGGIMVSEDVILPAIRRYVAKYAHTPWGEPLIVSAEHADQMALLGCEWLVEEQLNRQ
jgi:glucokinase